MHRREFLTGGTLGLTFATGSLAAGKTGLGAEDTAERMIDAGKLVGAAHRHFIPGKRTCCEAILMAGCEALGVKSDLVPDIALGLAGGVGLQGETCGVLTSSAMVLSLAVASRETEYSRKKARTLESVGRLHRAFRKQFGHTDCRSLCGLDLTTPEGRKRLMQGVKEQKCAKCVEAGAGLLAKELQRTA
ncbi:MAG: C-GCAxxG-C-C family protein [Planctomycetota bacterium]|jgi:C_GCAxxG_C_C family probable redox protein